MCSLKPGAMRASQQVTLKLPPPNASPRESPTLLQAAGAATLKLPPTSVLNANAKTSSVMTLKPHQAVIMAPIETMWEEPKPLSEHSERMKNLRQGVDHMSSAFRDATQTKAEKRRMMDEMHETALQRVEMTRKDINELLEELAAHLQEFQNEYEHKRKTLFEELHVMREERIAVINARWKQFEERQQALHIAIEEERQIRITEAEAILGPARRSVESLVVDLEKERELRRARHEELKQNVEDTCRMLTDTIESEVEVRLEKNVEREKELDIDVQRLKRRAVEIKQCNAEKVTLLQEAINAEELHRKEGQDQVVVKITDFIHRFQKHIKEEGEMGC